MGIFINLETFHSQLGDNLVPNNPQVPHELQKGISTPPRTWLKRVLQWDHHKKFKHIVENNVRIISAAKFTEKPLIRSAQRLLFNFLTLTHSRQINPQLTMEAFFF